MAQLNPDTYLSQIQPVAAGSPVTVNLTNSNASTGLCCVRGYPGGSDTVALIFTAPAHRVEHGSRRDGSDQRQIYRSYVHRLWLVQCRPRP